MEQHVEHFQRYAPRSDRFRTTVNIYSDSVGSAIVQQFSPLEILEDSGEETSVFQPQAVPKPVPPPQPKPEPEATGSGSQPEGEPNRETAEAPKLPSSWLKRRLSRFAVFPGHRAATSAGGARRTPSTSSASSRGSVLHGVLPVSDGSTDAGAPHLASAAEIDVTTSHGNDAESDGEASPLPQGIAVLGGWPTAGFRAFKASGAPPSSTALTQDGHDDQQAEMAPITYAAAADGTGAVGDVGSGRSRRHRRQRRTKEAKNDKTFRKSSKAGASSPRRRRSKKNRTKASLTPAMPDAVSAVPDEALLASMDAEHAARDLGGQASSARRSSTGAAARPVERATAEFMHIAGNWSD
ncbi:translation initiation factor IF-2-like [Dermacentor silvarum]|uniref:translation initiation factor IF-2-like n=1 Tax=Dermacentor silvarum TaxID=543639 RepID=UPI0021015914|nr:translation initiation factor IF-2-like [Dermacentor silvarum]